MSIYWKSLEELANNPEFEAIRHKEFVETPEEIAAEESQNGGGVDRRDFLKLMGASLVMASAAACTRRPTEKIVPYVTKPEELTIGVPNWYATTCGECPAACGALAKTREGRPIKLEGNDDHPMNKGGLCARGQASILNLYDPDRLRAPMKKKGEGWEVADWTAVDGALKAAIQDLQGKKGRIRLLTDRIVSPSARQLISEFLGQFADARHVEFEPLAPEELAHAQAACYGEAVVPRYRLDKAKRVVSFGAEFLDTWLSPVEWTHRFARMRRPKDGEMSRFVAFDPSASLTGSNADIHVPVRPDQALKLALALAHELIVVQKHSSFAYDSRIVGLLEPYAAASVAQEAGIDPNLLPQLAAELWQNQGQSLVLGGGTAQRGETGFALQVVANFINSLLGNDGATLDALNSPSLQAGGSYQALSSLIQEMNSASVDLLLIYKTNPAFSTPASLQWAEAVKRVPLVVRMADRTDETAQEAHWVLPSSHYLESWGDAEPQKGLFSLQQPTIAPLHDTRTLGENLLAWMGGISGHEYLKNYWQQNIYPRAAALAPFDEFWETTLRKGVLDLRRGVNGHPPRAFNTEALLSLKVLNPLSPVSGLSLVVVPAIAHYDGRSGNNSWLKELPDPITKITWRNYLSVAPETAQQHFWKEGDVVTVKAGAFSADLPVHIQPGLHPDVVVVPAGFGHTQTGRVGNNIGVNAFGFLGKSDGGAAFAVPVTLTPTGEWIQLASTQIHNTLHGRPIIHETTLEEYKKDPKAGNEEVLPLPTMWSEHKYEGYRWGMAIDLNACTGCSACVIACQAENNIPVVGEKQVKKGREMHWLRIDRYYSGDGKNPAVYHQPMLCQHCENAPCETVCPVIATLHDTEGLNVQVYNRCVGTRYCSNNCPYKVRRFNWFEYLRSAKVPEAMVLNPDVTVREKGVMEKCTFCTQRIQEAKNRAISLNRKVQDGELKTACQQSCPAEAIVFGDINDPESRVSRLAANPRGYHVLADLNVRPSITYLTRVRNV